MCLSDWFIREAAARQRSGERGERERKRGGSGPRVEVVVVVVAALRSREGTQFIQPIPQFSSVSLLDLGIARTKLCNPIQSIIPLCWVNLVFL